MNLTQLYEIIAEFSKGTHGSTDYYKDTDYVMGENKKQFAPMSFLIKKVDGLKDGIELLKVGMTCDSYELYDVKDFQNWYEDQFSRKLKRAQGKEIRLFSMPDNKSIFDAIETVNKSYELLRSSNILLNSKNLPVQLGEWYAKCIFGLHQKKSSSQRGFDFYMGDKRVEIKVHWSDKSSPKGVKIRKSLVELSDFCIVIYVAKNFMIREVCCLDSNFIMRKFAGKGHTIFLKDSEITQYFFSHSDKHVEKVANSSALLKYATPTFAMNIAEAYSKDKA